MMQMLNEQTINGDLTLLGDGRRAEVPETEGNKSRPKQKSVTQRSGKDARNLLRPKVSPPMGGGGAGHLLSL